MVIKTKTFCFLVEVTVGGEVSETDAREHLAEAVSCWKGGFEWAHRLTADDVEVKRFLRQGTAQDRDQLVVTAQAALTQLEYLAGLNVGSAAVNNLAVSTLRAALAKFPEETS